MLPWVGAPKQNISVNDALDFSKIEAGELQVEARPVFLRQMLPEVINVMRTTYRSPKGEVVGDVRLRLEMSESVAITQALADEDRIRQVRAVVCACLCRCQSNCFDTRSIPVCTVVLCLFSAVRRQNKTTCPRLRSVLCLETIKSGKPHQRCAFNPNVHTLLASIFFSSTGFIDIIRGVLHCR